MGGSRADPDRLRGVITLICVFLMWGSGCLCPAVYMRRGFRGKLRGVSFLHEGPENQIWELGLVARAFPC